jgi:hypothetical protein
MEKATIKFSNGFSSEPDWERFNTCKHRSKKEENYTIKTCCQHQQKTGWICKKIPIYGLAPNHCTDCPVFEVGYELTEEQKALQEPILHG